jgi:sRNA-binding carbon storage regulator CsrA
MMLVLGRGLNEEVVLYGQDGMELGRVIVAGVGREGGKVRLGFKFPKTIAIHRGEVADKIGSRILDGYEDFV